MITDFSILANLHNLRLRGPFLGSKILEAKDYFNYIEDIYRLSVHALAGPHKTAGPSCLSEPIVFAQELQWTTDLGDRCETRKTSSIKTFTGPKE